MTFFTFLSLEKAVPLSHLLPEQSIYIAGISKAFYAGLRVCFLAAPKRLCNRISQAVVDTVWMAPALNVEIACECISCGVADEIITRKRTEIQRRAALWKEKFSGYHYNYITNSMFAWLKLPDTWNSSSFEQAAKRNGVNIISSEKFSIGGVVPPNYVRVSISGAYHRNEFESGIDILLKILNYDIDLAGGIL